jgi:TolA-binding protein
MIRMSCLRIEPLIARRASGLSAAEALRLEEHLARCGTCRDAARILDGVRAVTEPDRLLSARARERALFRALEAAGRPGPSVAVRSARTGWIWPAVACAAAMLLVLALGVLSGSGRGGPSPSPELRAAASPEVDRVLGGDARIAGRVLRVGEPLQAESTVETVDGATLELGPARIELEKQGALRWDAARSTVHLVQGAVTVEIEPGQSASFRVATERFIVEVIGTRFRVEADGVRVERGFVRVRSPDGAVLADAVGAGTAWRAPSMKAAAELAPSPEASGAAQASASSAAPAGSYAPSAGELLSRARRRLARGDVAGARREIAAALTLRPGSADEGEASTLLAECALVAGNERDAARQYIEVARRHADLPSGENALFAAARLEANAGRAGAARALLRQYLARYPNGRFRAEAAKRLDALDQGGKP